MKNLIIVPTLAVSMIGLSYMATADGIQRARVNTVSQTSATENVNGSDRVFDNGSVTSKANPGTASREVTATGGRGGADRIVASECSDSSIDVNQPSNTTCMASFGQADLAQSFIPNAGSYSGAGINFTAEQFGDNVTIELWDALPNAGGTMMATGTSTTNGAWVDVSWDAVSVNPGSTYYLVFTCDTTSPCIAGDTNNPYPDGMTFANSGFGAFPNFDYTFRTYQCNDEPGGGDCDNPYMDIDQSDNSVYMAGFGQPDLAQSFTATTTSSVGASLGFTDAGPWSGHNVTIELWDALPNAGGSMLGSGSGVTDGSLWVDVAWSEASTTPGNTYYLVFTGDGGPQIAGCLDNCYDGGMVHANDGFGEFPEYDYTFRHYACEGGGGDPTGACCVDFTCQDAYTEADCTGMGGSYQGDGSDCADVDCGGGGGDCEQSVIDVDQPSNTTCMANFYQEDLAQSFIPGADNSTGAGIEFTSTSSGNTVSIGLWDALPNAGGTELASGTSTSSGDSWLDVSWNEVSVTPGNTYYLVFTLNSGDSGWCIGGDTNNPYPDGMTFANTGYGEFPNFDYTFRTYSCDDGGGGPCPADLNGDGVVDVTDLLLMISAWGPCP